MCRSAVGALLRTGLTGTNVADVVVALIAGDRASAIGNHEVHVPIPDPRPPIPGSRTD